jgi:hypothetical protein
MRKNRRFRVVIIEPGEMSTRLFSVTEWQLWQLLENKPHTKETWDLWRKREISSCISLVRSYPSHAFMFLQPRITSRDIEYGTGPLPYHQIANYRSCPESKVIILIASVGMHLLAQGMGLDPPLGKMPGGGGCCAARQRAGSAEELDRAANLWRRCFASSEFPRREYVSR